MGARGAKGPESRQGSIKIRGGVPHAGQARHPRMFRAKHGLAEVLILSGMIVRQKLVTLALLRAGEGLFSAIVDAGDSQAKELDGNAGDDLVIAWLSITGEPNTPSARFACVGPLR